MKYITIMLLTLLFAASCRQEQTTPVQIDATMSIKDGNHTSPLYVTIDNKTKNANGYRWTFEGGEPATSDQRNPVPVRFVSPGEHTITLEAWNDGDRTSKTFTVRVDSVMTIGFDLTADVNTYAPAVFHVTNRSQGGTSYRWTFTGGEPATFSGQHPPAIRYAAQGTYTVRLEMENGSANTSLEKQISVGEPLAASFSIIPSFEDIDDYEAPLRATFDTRLQGVKTLKWECAGASITGATTQTASIYFATAGTYTVYLDVSNGKENKRIAQTIVVKPNTNLRTHSNIRLGINTAQHTAGAYYSTRLRRSFTDAELTIDLAKRIDIVYFGLNADFSYNRFVSPDMLSSTPLKEIPGATSTLFINRQDLGATNISPTQFEAMTTDVLLRSVTLNQADYNTDYFAKTPLPRVVLFQTADGRKGAILVKEMVSNSKDNSYILADIKVQKND